MKQIGWVRAQLVVIAVLLAVAGVQQARIMARPETRAVFDYPDQRVISQLPGGRPGVYLGGELQVRGTKCNLTDRPIRVAGNVTWVSVDPPGSTIQTGTGNAERRPGCVTAVYSNHVPDVIAGRTRHLVATSGAPCVTWRVTGRETPTDPLDLPAVWQTEAFDVCP